MELISFLLLLFLVDSGYTYSGSFAPYLDAEKSFISDLEEYIESQESVLQFLRKKLLNFKVEHSEALENPEEYFSNELNKFLLVKRLTSDVDRLAEKTFQVANNFKLKVDTFKVEKTLPSKDELKSSALSISKLHQAQNMQTDKLAKGIFGNVKRRNGLSTEDCYQIGKQLNEAKVYSTAIKWLTEALKRYDEYYDQHQVKAIEILEELVLSFMGNNQVQEAKKVVEKVSRMNSKSHVLKFFKRAETTTKEKKNPKVDGKFERQKRCHSSHLLSSNKFTCPI